MNELLVQFIESKKGQVLKSRIIPFECLDGLSHRRVMYSENISYLFHRKEITEMLDFKTPILCLLFVLDHKFFSLIKRIWICHSVLIFWTHTYLLKSKSVIEQKPYFLPLL